MRQLGNFVERLVVLADGEVIDAAAVQAELDRPVHFTTDLGGAVAAASEIAAAAGTPVAAASSAPAADGVDHLSQVVRDAERTALLRALERCGGNRSDAARLLGVSRSTFYAKLEKYGLA